MSETCCSTAGVVLEWSVIDWTKKIHYLYQRELREAISCARQYACKQGEETPLSVCVPCDRTHRCENRQNETAGAEIMHIY